MIKDKDNKIAASNIMIGEMQDSDRDQILKIYGMGIDTKLATFETTVPKWEEFTSNHLPHSRFVAVLNGVVIGWIVLSPVSKRKAYCGVAEVSVYVDTGYLGHGIGSLLFEKAIESSESNGIWTLYSVVFPGNKASLKLHKRYGFRKIGIREKISRLDGIWTDTIILERRSRKIGI